MAEGNKNLRDYLSEIANEKGYGDGNIEIKPISTEGASYTSDLFFATISAPTKEDLELFIKVANISESVRATSSMFTIIYEKEHAFYSELAIYFEELYNKNGVPEKDRLYIPKFYGFKPSNLEETLVIENLSAKGFGSFDRMKTFDWDYAAKSVEVLAKFHALGLAFKQENFVEFKRLTKTDPIMSNQDVFKALIDRSIKIGTQVIKEEYRERVGKYFDSNDFLTLRKKLWPPSDTGSLVHSDFKPNNLMHRRQDGKLEIVLVDYQAYKLGTLVSDLMNFTWVGSDAQFRKDHYKQLIEHYYTELTQALQNLNVDIDQVYSRKVFEQELEEFKTLGLLMGLGIISYLLVDLEKAPNIENVDDLVMEPNQIAMDRMNGIVADYVTSGII